VILARKVLERSIAIVLALVIASPVYGLEGLSVDRAYTSSVADRTSDASSSLFRQGSDSGVSPQEVSFDLSRGGSQTLEISVQTAPTPVPKVDILFLFDVSSSMDAALDEAKSRGMEVMTGLQESIPDAAFGVASFSDYPGYFESPSYVSTYGGSDDYPWRLDYDISSDLDAVQSAVTNLEILNGEDDAESYTRALFEALNIGWRPGAKRIIVLFGDSVAHDPSFYGDDYGIDPGRDSTIGTADDLNFEDVVSQAGEKGIEIISVGPDAALSYENVRLGFDFMSSQTGGEVLSLNESNNLVDVVAAGLSAATSTISSLSLSVDEPYQDWIQTDPASFSDVGGDEVRTFEVTLTIPADAELEMHQFGISALGDGALLGISNLTINIQGDLITPTPSPSELVTMTIDAEPKTAGTDEAITVEIHLSGDSSKCEVDVVVKPVDVYLVIDHSGSMDGEPLEQAKLAAQAFVREIDLTNDRVGIVPFSDAGEMLQPLTNSTDALVTAIDSIAQGGGTSVDSGLMVAYESLSTELREDTTPVIILLSDGQSSYSSAIHVAETAKAAGVRIITIGLGGADENLLRDIASPDKNGQPQYYFAPNPSDLQDIYVTIAQNIREYGLAKNLTLRHQVDLYKFAIVPESPNPPATIAGDTITWNQDLLDGGDTVFTFQVRGRVEGEYEVGLLTEAQFLECERTSRVVQIGPAPIVTIKAGPTTACESSCAWWQTFPWWIVITILALFVLLALFFLTPLGRILTEKPIQCRIMAGLLSLYILFLIGMVSNILLGHLCNSDRIYFWKYTTSTDIIGVYQTDLGQDSASTVQSLNQGSDCVACHTIGSAGADPALAVVRDDQNGEILMQTLSGDEVPLPPVNGSYIAWSPDGSKVAISANDRDIQIIDIATGSIELLNGASSPDFVETMPAWSADGGTIAFVRASQTAEDTARIDVPSDIYTVPAAGGNALPLPGASGDGFNYYPVYSPDGKWMAFTRHIDGQHTYADNAADIYLVPANGGERILLRSNTEDWADSWPSWSPDSKWLGFSSDRLNDQFDIYLTKIAPNGQSVEACILPGADSESDEEFHPVWFRPLSLPWWQRLMDLWPWLIPLPILLLIAWLVCRKPKLTVTVVDGIRGTRISGATVEMKRDKK
jgi:uncharacterized protein YegL